MKRLKSLLCMLVIVLGSMCLWACGDEKEKEVTLTSVTTNLEEFYSKTDTINWDELKVTLNYSDKSKKEYGADVGEFDVEVSSAKESTKWVLATDGLKEQTAGNMTEKKYNLVLSIVGQEATYPIRVVVGVNEAVVYTLANFNLPERIASFQENTKVENGINKNGFKTVENAKYYVGADNGFDITPSYTLYEKDSTNETGKTDSTFKISLDVKVLQGTTAVGSEIYSYDDKGTIQFTSDAVGKEFTIKIKPTFFTKDNSGYDIEELSFDVTVADGYNIYTAKDLGMLCVPQDETQLDRANTNGVSRFARIYSGSIFYADNNTFTSKQWWSIWKSFLQQQNMTAKYIKGAFIQNDISLTAEDIPSEFFITAGETNSDYAKGKLRDDLVIYTHYMFDDFTFQGNYFTIDASGLPVNGQNSDFKTDSNAGGYIDKAETNPGAFGHTKLFNFIGQKVGDSKNGANEDSNKESNEKKLFISNVNSIGNTQESISTTSKDESSSNDYSATGGLILFMNASCSAEVENINIKSAMIGWYVESTDKADNGLGNKASKAQPTTINNVNISNCFNSGLFLYGAQGGCTITNSSFANFGGPAIFAISTHRGGDSSNINEEKRGSYVSYDNTVEFNNYIGGGEAWFSVYRAGNLLVSNFRAFDNAFKTQTKRTTIKSFDNVGKFNLKVLFMDEGYIGSQTKYLHGKVNDYNFEINDKDNVINVSGTTIHMGDYTQSEETKAGILKTFTVNKGIPFVWTDTNDLKFVYATTNEGAVTGSTLYDLSEATKLSSNSTATPATILNGNELSMIMPCSSTRFAMIVDLYNVETTQSGE